MKYGILTFQDTTNFGSALQCYGLCRAMRNCGIACEIIDYECDAIRERELGKREGNWAKQIARYILFGYHNDKKNRSLRRFLTNESMISTQRYLKDTIKKANNEYNGFVSGSDIIWGIDITKGDLTYFLDFAAPDKKRYAFASSIGDRWDHSYDAAISKELKRFNKIYVREHNAIEIIKEVADVQADLVCDPTMLLEVKYWESVASERYKKSNYVLVYFGNEKLLSQAREYAGEIKASVYIINYGIPLKGGHNIRPTTVEDFLSLIKYAKGVFTGSYHGMLFSLYYQRKFIVFNRAHSSRMKAVLKMVELECREYGKGNIEEAINYEEVNRRITVFRNESLKKLELVLEN